MKMAGKRESSFGRLIVFPCLFFGLILIFTSCSTSSESKDDAPERRAKGSEHLMGKEAGVEDFDSFFAKFSKDSLFQTSRIDFPVSLFEWPDNEEAKELEKRLIPEKDWGFVDFSEDEQWKTKEVDAFETEVSLSGDSAVYHRNGIDNGINMEFHFVRKDGAWRMVKVVDMSN